MLGKIYLPKKNHCSLRFMKEILAKKKRFVKYPQADQQPVPNHKSLEVT